jgi:phosphatidate cytidylyltransferase
MLAQRVMTALVLLVAMAAALFAAEHLYFEILILIFVTAALWEWLRLNAVLSPWPIILAPIGALAMFVLWRYVAADIHQSLWWVSIIAWVVIALPALHFGLKIKARFQYSVLAFLVLTACYIAMNALHMAKGSVYLLSVLLITWVADIAGYFVGRAWGKHKLAPSISPGKTIEGAAGALIGVVVYGAACIFGNSFFGQPLFPAEMATRFGAPIAMLILIGLGLASIFGDLVESLFKRKAGAKDSSRLLPGHGGVLDRIDALLPVLPLAALLTFLGN